MLVALGSVYGSVCVLGGGGLRGEATRGKIV